MEKTIIAQLSVKKENIMHFLKYAKIMIEKSNLEKGCLSYRLFNEINKPNEFIFYEKYNHEKAVISHNKSEHFKIFLKSVSDLLSSEPDIEIF